MLRHRWLVVPLLFMGCGGSDGLQRRTLDLGPRGESHQRHRRRQHGFRQQRRRPLAGARSDRHHPELHDRRQPLYGGRAGSRRHLRLRPQPEKYHRFRQHRAIHAGLRLQAREWRGKPAVARRCALHGQSHRRGSRARGARRQRRSNANAPPRRRQSRPRARQRLSGDGPAGCRAERTVHGRRRRGAVTISCAVNGGCCRLVSW